MANTMLEVNGLTTKYITRFREDVYAARLRQGRRRESVQVQQRRDGHAAR